MDATRERGGGVEGGDRQTDTVRQTETYIDRQTKRRTDYVV